MANLRGKSIKAVTYDISEGYVAVNPIFLKMFEPEQLIDIYREISKTQNDIRAERFPAKDLKAIRGRNLRLQRLHSAAMIVRNFARERRILLV